MTEQTPKTDELQVVIDQNGLEQETRIALKNAFDPFYLQTAEWKQKAEGLVVTDATQVQEMAEAREARLALKDIRVNVEKKRKELKEDSLRKGKAIDSIANVLKDLITPIEGHLELQEKFVEIQQEAARKELKLKRSQELGQYGTNPDFYQLADMSEEEYQAILDAAIYMANKKKEDERKAEEARQEAARLAEEKRKADEAERIRLAEENKKLKAQVKEVKTELKQTTEVLKETKTVLQQEKKAFEGFATGAGLAYKNGAIDTRTPKKEAPARAAVDPRMDVANMNKVVLELQAIQIPEMETETGKKLAQGIKTLLAKVVAYTNEHIDQKAGKIL